MSLQTQLENLALRTATQDKVLKTLINGNAADLTALATTNKTNLVAALNEIYAVVSGATEINDTTAGTDTTYSSTKIEQVVSTAISDLVNGAPTALDTLNELAAALAEDDSAIAAITTALENRVRFDAVQTLTAAQAAQARANIGAVAAEDIGDPNTDFVAVYESGL